MAQFAYIPGIHWLILGTKHLWRNGLDWKLGIQRAIGMDPEGLFLPCIGNAGRLRRWGLIAPICYYSPGPEHSLVLQDILSVGEEQPRNPFGSHRNSSRFKLRTEETWTISRRNVKGKSPLQAFVTAQPTTMK